MRKGFGFVLLVTVTMAIALEAHRVPEALARAELFRVDQVAVEGARYLTADEVVAAGAIPEGASFWDDFAPVALRLKEHPGIREARVRRGFPARLVLEVVERDPVAFLPSPTLVPVDIEGRLLPFDPATHRLDLPLLQPRRGPAPDGLPLTPAQIRTLAAELHHLGGLAPNVLASVSEAALDGGGDVLLHLSEPRVTLQYRTPLSARRLQEGLTVLADALERHPDRRPIAVDLRFADQVVVRFSNPNGR